MKIKFYHHLSFWFVGLALLPLAAAQSSPQNYERDVTKWQEVTPDESLAGEESDGAKPPFPDLKWQVHNDDGEKVFADATVPDQSDHNLRPPFQPRWKGNEMLADSWLALPVDDGWIIGFDIGEFGAGVEWYSKDGSKEYDVAREYIQQFLATPDGIFTQGGLTHMGANSGAVCRLEKKEGKWQLTRVVDTPARVPIHWLGNHQLVLVQDRSTVYTCLVDYRERDWSKKSLSSDEHVRVNGAKYYAHGQYAFTGGKLYTADFGYVTELDLHSLKLRFLVPDSRFVNDHLRREISFDATH